MRGLSEGKKGIEIYAVLRPHFPSLRLSTFTFFNNKGTHTYQIYEGFPRITAKLTTFNFHKLKAKGIFCL